MKNRKNFSKIAVLGATIALTAVACGSDDADPVLDDTVTTDVTAETVTTDVMDETVTTDVMDETVTTDVMEETVTTEVVAEEG